VDKESNNTSPDIHAANPTDVQARLVTAVENAAEAIIITDIEGNIQYVNPAFE